MDNDSLLKQPSAWIPFVMSFAALMLLLGYVAYFGMTDQEIVQHKEEGAPARIFQLIMIAQLPEIASFAVKWLPKRPRHSLLVLALQSIAWIVPIAAVIWLERL